MHPVISGYSRKTYIATLKKISSGVLDVSEYDNFIIRDLMIMGYIDGQMKEQSTVLSVQRININGVLFLGELEKAEREASFFWGAFKFLRWLVSLISAAAVGYLVKESLGG